MTDESTYTAEQSLAGSILLMAVDGGYDMCGDIRAQAPRP